MSFEVEKVNNLVHFRREDMDGQQQQQKIHIPANIISDYTLEFIIEIYFWNHFNKQFCNTSHERQMAAQDLRKKE